MLGLVKLVDRDLAAHDLSKRFKHLVELLVQHCLGQVLDADPLLRSGLCHFEGIAVGECSAWLAVQLEVPHLLSDVLHDLSFPGLSSDRLSIVQEL